MPRLSMPFFRGVSCRAPCTVRAMKRNLERYAKRGIRNIWKV